MENLRISSYIIPVKLEREEDKYMLIHGYTGAMDVVDKELKNYLISTMNIERSKFPYSDLVFDRLLKRGYLTIKSKSEEHDFVLKLANALHKRKLKKQFTLLVTYNCNFQCPYCFEKQIVQKSNETYSHVISEKLVDNAFEAINIIEPNEYLQSKKISLFGGEPLLKENKSIVEYILEKGKERGFNFSATSNGYDIDQYEKYLSKEYINGIQITIDGTKEIHNLRRIGPSPDGSFDKIIDNIELALSKGILIKARINVDDKNISSIKSLCSFF